MFEPGDRVRWETVDEDGFPIVQYGFVDGEARRGTRVTVLFDHELTTQRTVDAAELAVVTITSLELCLDGVDLLDEPALRQGLVNLWAAEADQAGLEIRSIDVLGSGVRETEECFALAELWSAGRPWLLKARPAIKPGYVTVRAESI